MEEVQIGTDQNGHIQKVYVRFDIFFYYDREVKAR